MTLNQNQPLSDAERDKLDQFLADAGPKAMTFEAMDGFLAALISGPDLVLPSEYLPEIWGEPAFENMEQAQTMMGLLMRHWNTIASTLLQTLDQFGVYAPVLAYDETGVARGNDWATGFMRGVQLRPHSWAELLDSESTAGLVMPMMMLAQEDNPKPGLPAIDLTPEKRIELLEFMTSSLTHIYRFFEPHRRRGSVTPNPTRRAGPKIRRNDPCPCGSGRKSKHCCANGTPFTVH